MVSATCPPKVWKLHALNTEAYQQTLNNLRTEADAWCVCRKPDDGSLLMECSGGCEDRFHPGSVDVADVDAESATFVYMCSRCQGAQCLLMQLLCL